MREIKYKYWYSGKMLEVGQIEFFTDGTYLVNGELAGGVLLEWTGLHDKNGKEVYEGDICKTNTNRIIEILYSEEQLRWDFRVIESGEYEALMYMELEVIGNIYQNPDLLKETK